MDHCLSEVMAKGNVLQTKVRWKKQANNNDNNKNNNN